jgi:hypothetical protein
MPLPAHERAASALRTNTAWCSLFVQRNRLKAGDFDQQAAKSGYKEAALVENLDRPPMLVSV